MDDDRAVVLSASRGAHARPVRGSRVPGPRGRTLEDEQEAAYVAMCDRRDRVHTDGPRHARWAKKHFCPLCYRAWQEQGEPGALGATNHLEDRGGLPWR